MLMTIYKRAFSVLMKKPLKLWGISLLAIVLSSVLSALCGVAIPVLGLAVSLLISTSMTIIFLKGYRGEEVEVTQLFACFKDWNTIKRVTLGLGWMLLWIFLWSLIPIVGPIFALIRTYEYVCLNLDILTFWCMSRKFPSLRPSRSLHRRPRAISCRCGWPTSCGVWSLAPRFWCCLCWPSFLCWVFCLPWL